MQTAHEYFRGYPPKVVVMQGNPQAAVYGRMWATEEYRAVSPGELLVPVILDVLQPPADSQFLDLGCGTGRAALQLMRAGHRATMVDFVRNSLDAEVRQAMDEAPNRLSFVKADLEGPLPVAAPYAICCDVMEHIPPDRVEATLRTILLAAQTVFFSISTVEDVCGAMIDTPLHLTVQPAEWWRSQLEALGATVQWQAELPHGYCVAVSGWCEGQTVVDAGIVNTEDAEIREHVATNLLAGYQEACPYESQPDAEVVILGGGPSLAAHLPEIRALHQAGAKIVTLNGAYQWAHEHGIWPVTQIMVDARAFNARFVQPVDERCLYLLASQCHPSVFEALPKDRVWLWHTGADLIADLVTSHRPFWWPVPGGSTVLLRAIPLLRMLGYAKFHLFGCDSCLMDGEHHAYAQTENDSPTILNVVVNAPAGGGRVFRCHPWMAAQASEFLELIRKIGDLIEINVQGDGLLRHILEVGAQSASLLTEPTESATDGEKGS